MHALGRPQTCRPPALRGAAAAGQRRRPRGPAAREGCMSLCCARSGGLTPHGARHAGGGAAAVAACRDLLAHFEVTADQFQVGRTKLFFRAGVLGRLEDAAARINRHARARPPARPAACAACAGGAAATAAIDAWALPCSSISKAPPWPACCRVRVGPRRTRRAQGRAVHPGDGAHAARAARLCAPARRGRRHPGARPPPGPSRARALQGAVGALAVTGVQRGICGRPRAQGGAGAVIWERCMSGAIWGGTYAHPVGCLPV